MEIILTKEELANEKWVDFEWCDMKYRISNMGRIMSYCGTVQRLMKPQQNQYGEVQVVLVATDREMPHNIMVGKEVAKRFVPNPEGFNYIRYKDGNKLNCKASNIEWAKQTEKMEAQYKALLKKVNQYDLTGKYIQTFESSAAAGESLGETRDKIAAYCNGNLRPFNGFFYRYDEDFPAGENIQPPVKKQQTVYQFEKNGRFVQKFESARAAEEYFGKKHMAGNITRCAKGERPSVNGYVWRFSEDFYKV